MLKQKSAEHESAMKMAVIDSIFNRRLIWVLGGLFPLLIFAVAMFFLFIRQQENAIQRLLDEASRNAANVVDRAIGEQIGLLNGLSVSPALDFGDFEAFRQEAGRLWKMHPEWRTVIVTDRFRPVFNIFFPAGKPIPPLKDKLSLDQVWISGEPFVGNLAHGYVAIRIPIVREGKIVYTLVVPTDPRYFRDALKASPKGLVWGFIIVGSDDIVIEASKNSPVKAGMRLPTAFGKKTAAETNQEPLRHGTPAAVRSSNWQIYVFAPAAEVEGPFLKVRKAVTIGCALAILLTPVFLLMILSAWTAKQESLKLRREIEEKARTEKALRQSEQRFKDIFNNVSIGMCLVSLGGRIQMFNPMLCEMLGYNEQELPEMLRFDTGAGDSGGIEADYFRSLLNGETTAVSFEKQLTHKDGRSVYTMIGAFLLRDEAGQPKHFIMHIKDTTENRILEDQLRQAQKMESIGNLAGGIAHDFNNILFPIIGLSELLMEDFPQESPQHQNAGVIFNAALRGSELVKQILAYSRQSKKQVTPTPIVPIITEAVKLCRSTIPSDIGIVTEIPEDAGWVMMDPTHLHQIVMNLVTNAFHAIEPASGTISIALQAKVKERDDNPGYLLEPGRYALLTISDTGNGIDPAVIDKIFEPYFTTKEPGKGTGLGLAVAFGIIRGIRGDIRVTSELGKGTIFEVYLPLLDTAMATGQKRNAATSGKAGTERILLVDDEAQVLNIERQMLERLGYRVTVRTSSIEALETFSTSPDAFDLVISDMTMPDMTGDQLARELISIRSNIPIILCTGFSEKIDEKSVAAMGIQGLLMKPVLRAEMARMVRTVLNASSGE